MSVWKKSQDVQIHQRGGLKRCGRRPFGTGASEEAACPPHPGFMHGMCIRCGAVEQDEGTSGVALRCAES